MKVFLASILVAVVATTVEAQGGVRPNPLFLNVGPFSNRRQRPPGPHLSRFPGPPPPPPPRSTFYGGNVGHPPLNPRPQGNFAQLPLNPRPDFNNLSFRPEEEGPVYPEGVGTEGGESGELGNVDLSSLFEEKEREDGDFVASQREEVYGDDLPLPLHDSREQPSEFQEVTPQLETEPQLQSPNPESQHPRDNQLESQTSEPEHFPIYSAEDEEPQLQSPEAQEAREAIIELPEQLPYPNEKHSQAENKPHIQEETISEVFEIPIQDSEPITESYKPPTVSYELATESYIPVTESYEQPEEHFEAPAERFKTQTSRFEQPTQRYEPPTQRFEPPTERFEPPMERFEPPTQRYKPLKESFEPLPQQYEETQDVLEVISAPRVPSRQHSFRPDTSQQLYRRPTHPNQLPLYNQANHQREEADMYEVAESRETPTYAIYDYEDEEELEDDEVEKPDRLTILLLDSAFSCIDKKNGYYADEDVECEVFHYCQDRIKHSWLCPQGASFHQVHLICLPRSDDNICARSSKFHFVNDFLYKETQADGHNITYADRYYPEGFVHGETEVSSLFGGGGEGGDGGGGGSSGGGGGGFGGGSAFREPSQPIHRPRPQQSRPQFRPQAQQQQPQAPQTQLPTFQEAQQQQQQENFEEQFVERPLPSQPPPPQQFSRPQGRPQFGRPPTQRFRQRDGLPRAQLRFEEPEDLLYRRPG